MAETNLDLALPRAAEAGSKDIIVKSVLLALLEKVLTNFCKCDIIIVQTFVFCVLI